MNITVYCGSSSGKQRRYAQIAGAVGRWIGEEGHGLVYGGGKVGLMGELADGVLSAGGQVTGVIPEFMQKRELAHRGLTKLELVHTMSERKARMVELGHIFIALPGGAGTLEEISEVISWRRLGIHQGECIFFNVGGFYDSVKDLYQRMIREGFYLQEDFDHVHFVSDLKELASICKSYK